MLKAATAIVTQSALLAFPIAVNAQVANSDSAGPILPSSATGQVPSVVSVNLPAGTEVVLRLNSPLTTRSGAAQVGTKFFLTVVYDVYGEGRVVIPQGTPAVGEVTWRTGKGVFGKSGKMEIAFRHIDLQGRQIPLEGSHRQEGSGNTAATVGATVATLALGAGLFITGKSAEIQAGREFAARTQRNEVFALK